MKFKMFKKIIFNFKLYLLVGVTLIFLAPISEFSHWTYRSQFFAKWAFILFCLSSVILFVNRFFDVHPKLGRRLKQIIFRKKPWSK